MGFELIPAMCRLPTYTFAIELLLLEKETRFQKRPGVYFCIGAGQTTTALQQPSFSGSHVEKRERERERERERAGIFFGLYSWLSTADPCPVRHETLTESDLFWLYSCYYFFGCCWLFQSFFWTSDKIGFLFRLVVLDSFIIFFCRSESETDTRAQIKRLHKK